MHPVVGDDRFAVWPSRVAGKQETCMHIWEHSAAETLVKPCLIENSGLEIFRMRRYVRFPSQTWNHGQVRIGLPGVLEVRAEIALPGVPPHKCLLLELRRFSQQEIAQRQSGVLRVEREFARRRGARQIIGCGMDMVHTKSDLMPSAGPTD